MLLVFLWIGFLTFNTLSTPSVIIQMQDLDVLPNGMSYYFSYMFK